MASQISRIRKQIILSISVVAAAAVVFLLLVLPILADMTPQAAQMARLNLAVLGLFATLVVDIALRRYLRPISDLGYALEIGSTPAQELVHDARRRALNAPFFFFLLPVAITSLLSVPANLMGVLFWPAYGAALRLHSLAEQLPATLLGIASAACVGLIVALSSRRWMRPVLLYTAPYNTVGRRLSIRTRLVVAVLTMMVTALLFSGVFAHTRIKQLHREQIADIVRFDLRTALAAQPDDLNPDELLPYLAGEISAATGYELLVLLDDNGLTRDLLALHAPPFSFDSQLWLPDRPSTVRQANGYFVLAPTQLAGQPYWIAVGFTPSALRIAGLGYTLAALGGLGVLALGLAALVGYFAAADIAVDLGDIRARLIKVVNEDRAGVGAELPVLSHDEIGDLILAYNDLQKQIRGQQEQVEHKQRQLTALQALSFKIGTIHNIDHLLHEIVRDTERTFGYHNVSVLLLDEQEQELYFAATDLSDPSLRNRRFRVGQDGVVGRAAASREPLMVNDVSACDYYIPDRTNTRSELAVPMIQGDEVIGVLNVSSERTGAFEEADLRVLTALANQLAIAIENTRLLSEVTTNAGELERRARNLMILNNISLALSTSLQIDELLATTVEQLASLFEIGHCAVILIDEEEGSGEFVVEHPARGMRGKRVTIQDMPAARRILASRQPVFITDAQRSEQLKPLRARLEEIGIRSMLLVPMTTKGSVEGIILLNAIGEQRYFTPDELGICQTVAAQVAVAIENVRLIENLRQQADSLSRMARDVAADRGQLDAILRTLADGLLVTDPEGRVLLSNPAFSFLFNLDQVPKGLSAASLVPGLPLRQMIAQVSSNHLSGFHAPAVQEAKLPDGRYFQITAAGVERRASPNAHQEERLAAVVMVLHDVTQERQLDAIKSDFISAVSHELRTPLTPVMGFARLIQKSFQRTILPAVEDREPARQAAERIAQNLDILIAEVDQLRDMVEDVLFLADLDADRLKWHLQTFDLDPILSQVLDEFRLEVEAKGLELQVHADDLPPIYADPDRLVRVIRNLISNAIKFTNQGRITVYAQELDRVDGQWLDVPYVRVPGQIPVEANASLPSGSYLLFAVRDTGPGISLEAQQTLFERFGQGMRDVLTEKPEGTGLGLALSKEIIRYHRGQIWVESEPERGSVFGFLLPLSGNGNLAQSDESVTSATPERGRPDRTPLILVADSDPAMRELLYQVLDGAGYRTMTAVDGPTALSMTRVHQPDLIVLDVMLPGISGIDITTKLHADQSTSHIPIILTSILADQARAIELGAAASFAKPLDQDAFVATVVRLLSRRRVSS